MRESTALDEMICFQLYAASRSITALYRPLLDPHGLTYPQYLVLRVLWHDGPTTVRDLGRTLRLDSGTLSPLLKRLAAQGHLTRVRGADDERTVLISLTDSGLRLRDAIGDLTQALLCSVNLTVDELTQLHSLLIRARG
ncbi:MarR family transcriptional regulator [Actinoplanes sp. SE50]|uniref:MarR family winged helix-turn-helix transcriptional regulator n=1 Tax=unclassified Actinoplanes TaxID=2626549 RepID=UPI00023EC2E3|nr:MULTISPECIES: MarR family transcriptional regulator [unclassified Actinoplanes]AEV85247.1 HTH-type transcriptional regulator sarZ [Actinoplanes sp. SE50/110]ATO83642.1 MarR family transcriptional regulator [Actinoplanes sp. SE50]SLM01050.1 MarR family transcriptional regulator [Actinoplanes sp. SE50/110]